MGETEEETLNAGEARDEGDSSGATQELKSNKTEREKQPFLSTTEKFTN
jgi:hypothetical protein